MKAWVVSSGSFFSCVYDHIDRLAALMIRSLNFLGRLGKNTVAKQT